MFKTRLQIRLKIGKVANILLSRTSGVAASLTVLKGITVNSKHGWRISKSFKGLNLAFQNKGIYLRGRWSSRSGYNLNLSKKGFSASKSFGKGSVVFGTYNFFNPKKSSLTIFGIQKRGKSVQTLAGLLAFTEIIWNLIQLLFIPIKILYFFTSRYLIYWILELLIFYSKLILIVLRYIFEVSFSILQFIYVLLYSISGMSFNLIFFTTKQFKKDLLNKDISRIKFFYRYGWIPILILIISLKFYFFKFFEN